VNPAARDLERELRRFEYKVEAGAEFAVTRPIFDVAALERFLQKTAHCRVPILAGLWIFESALNAEFMANELPEVVVPDALVQRMRATQGSEAALVEGTQIARDLLAELRPMIAGAVVSAPEGQVERALAVLRP
jgi:methionine synthase / methylenetetrahydrofolate reductase(NADPH)